MQTQKQTIETGIASDETLLINMEKSVLAAFKNKDDRAFTKNFAEDYIGVANDGVKTAEDEIAGMHKLNLHSLSLTGEKVTFPAKDMGIITYKMVVQGTLNEQDISGSIYSSSVYLKRDNEWVTVLHTESKSQ